MNPLLNKPSASIPIVLSLIVLAIWLVSFAQFGPPVHVADEGTGAHPFQIWLVLEIFMVAYFALSWLPRKPMQALFILAIQIISVLAACAPVFILKL